MYSILRQYQIHATQRIPFEEAYGRGGSWQALFSESIQYRGSYLHRSDTEEGHYLLIDTWISREAYEEFMRLHERPCTALTVKLQPLYQSSYIMGTFYSV